MVKSGFGGNPKEWTAEPKVGERNVSEGRKEWQLFAEAQEKGTSLRSHRP